MIKKIAEKDNDAYDRQSVILGKKRQLMFFTQIKIISIVCSINTTEHFQFSLIIVITDQGRK